MAIIGSGPGGLGAALALSPQNNNNCHGSVAVFERASAFRPIAVPLVPPSVSVCWATKLWKSWAWRYVLLGHLTLTLTLTLTQIL